MAQESQSSEIKKLFSPTSLIQFFGILLTVVVTSITTMNKITSEVALLSSKLEAQKEKFEQSDKSQLELLRSQSEKFEQLVVSQKSYFEQALKHLESEGNLRFTLMEEKLKQIDTKKETGK